MARFPLIVSTALLALTSAVQAQCGSGTPDARVTGSGNSFTATRGNANVYTGSDYRAAIQAALDAVSPGQRVSVIASGSIGQGTISVPSGRVFEVCGTINVGNRAGRGSIESINTNDASIPYLTMTGNPYFGLRFSGTKNLKLGQINFNLSGGLAIRFDRDAARNSNVTMDVINGQGAGSHLVEIWNVDGLKINQVIARNIGECGLLIQASRDVWVGLVDGTNVATGNGYATLRFANNNGQLADGSYRTNVYIDKIVARGGGRGSNAMLLENCYNVRIKGGTVTGGGEVRLAARSEFPNNKDIWINLNVSGTSVRESPCGENTNWTLSGSGSRNICA